MNAISNAFKEGVIYLRTLEMPFLLTLLNCYVIF